MMYNQAQNIYYYEYKQKIVLHIWQVEAKSNIYIQGETRVT